MESSLRLISGVDVYIFLQQQGKQDHLFTTMRAKKIKKIDLKKKTSMLLLTVTNQIGPAKNTKEKGSMFRF